MHLTAGLQMKSVFIIQSNYIPWKGYFDAINAADEVILYDDMQYTKNDWRNRNKIKTAQGTQWISIPIDVKGKLNQKINESKVSNRHFGWRKAHWKALQLSYSNAPYFNSYKSIFEMLYLQNDEVYLSKINYSFIKSICEILGIETTIRWSSEFKLIEGRNERLVALCGQTKATDYIIGPSAKSYVNEKLFAAEGINIHWLDYSGYPEYKQLYGIFVHEVSIIDLIFNEGPNAKNYLKSFSGSSLFESSATIENYYKF
jgi:hypothetical protein